ncbi:MAG: hypothetical protein KJN98_03005 [Pontiella sp.]|nr:hypothetical protein [Pontiella sp.]
MKTKLMIIASLALAFSSVAQPTNDVPHSDKKTFRPEKQRREGWRESSPERKAEMQERRLQLMERSLDKIGVSEEQRNQIRQLQMAHGEAMKANSKQISEARKQLSKLQDDGASEAEIDAAIDAVTAAQADQLKILVRNRMEMEKLLGKEKYALFMDRARNQFRKHGRRGGSGMPPRPGLPPVPGDGDREEDSPPPPPDLEEERPPTP